jgi:hypothetical protein
MESAVQLDLRSPVVPDDLGAAPRADMDVFVFGGFDPDSGIRTQFIRNFVLRRFR